MTNNWSKQERRTAERYKGQRSPGSGSGLRRNDVRNEDLLIENKWTGNQRQITLLAKDLESLRKHAIVEGRIPVLQFDLAGRNYVALLEGDFLDIIGHDG